MKRAIVIFWSAVALITNICYNLKVLQTALVHQPENDLREEELLSRQWQVETNENSTYTTKQRSGSR